MKLITSIILASLALVFAGCTTTGTNVSVNPESAKLVEKVAVQYAVLKVTQNNPDSVQQILKVAKAVQAAAGSEGFNTVDLLIAYTHTLVDTTKLKPEEALLANALIDAVGAELKSRIGTGTINSDQLLIVNEVAGWIVDQATVAAAGQK